MPGIGFFVKAGRRFAKRMEPNKFVDTNLLINGDPLKIGNSFASRILKDVLRSKRPPPVLGGRLELRLAEDVKMIADR